MSSHCPQPNSSVPGRPASEADPPKGMLGLGSPAALIAAGVVAVVGAGLVLVLVAGLLDGVRGIGPVLLGGLAIGAFVLAARLFVIARWKSPGRTPVPRRRPRPR